ncbi:MAG: hypothetical protein AAF467_05960 [Actinomycetota bacterium]
MIVLVAIIVIVVAGILALVWQSTTGSSYRVKNRDRPGTFSRGRRMGGETGPDFRNMLD